ncbi:hypothetical protein CDAR_25191 [Caerostris darwini]|uniref:Uncharacterized protein n=1 Tax=Caerostris darwini TaxID=1538125 RepID=A0AAV4QFR0_9ARAC|nr:hypothetical protein CDAR_25191 [Caerostris darwini]
MESRQSGIPNFELALFQEYDAVAVARKSDRTQKNTSCVSYLNGTSLDVQYHGNPCTGKSSHTAALQHESTNTNTVQKEKFQNELINIQNIPAYQHLPSEIVHIPILKIEIYTQILILVKVF